MSRPAPQEQWRPSWSLVLGAGIAGSVLLALYRAGVAQLAIAYVTTHNHATTWVEAEVGLASQLLSELLTLPGEVVLESLFLLLVMLALAPRRESLLGPGMAWARLVLAYAAFTVITWLGLLLVVPGVLIVAIVAFTTSPYRLTGFGRRKPRDLRRPLPALVLGIGLLASGLFASVIPLFVWTQGDLGALALSTVGSGCWLGTLAAYAWFHRRA